MERSDSNYSLDDILSYLNSDSDQSFTKSDENISKQVDDCIVKASEKNCLNTNELGINLKTSEDCMSEDSLNLHEDIEFSDKTNIYVKDGINNISQTNLSNQYKEVDGRDSNIGPDREATIELKEKEHDSGKESCRHRESDQKHDQMAIEVNDENEKADSATSDDIRQNNVRTKTAGVCLNESEIQEAHKRENETETKEVNSEKNTENNAKLITEQTCQQHVDIHDEKRVDKENDEKRVATIAEIEKVSRSHLVVGNEVDAGLDAHISEDHNKVLNFNGEKRKEEVTVVASTANDEDLITKEICQQSIDKQEKSETLNMDTHCTKAKPNDTNETVAAIGENLITEDAFSESVNILSTKEIDENIEANFFGEETNSRIHNSEEQNKSEKVEIIESRNNLLVDQCNYEDNEGEQNNNCVAVDNSEEKMLILGVTEDESKDYEEYPRTKVSRSQSICSQSDGDIINQFLDKSTDDAEARLLARRLARAEAREIRMRELERQQKEQEENADRQFDMLSEPVARAARMTGSRYFCSRRSSEDSLEDGGSIREIRHELKEVEEKFRKAMIANAQLDNDKASQTYQLELLKDRLEELEEEHSQLKREHRDKCREHDQLKRLATRLKDDLAVTQAELEERDRLISEKGLVIVGEDPPPDEQPGPSDGVVNGLGTPRKALVSAENAQLLENSGEGSLDVRLARFAKEKGELQDQISHLKLELEEERSKRRKSNASGVTLNGPTSDSEYDAADIQREVSKQLAEYKFRAQKAEQDVATLQANVARLESQVIRYKSASEVLEKSEEALKAEKRKLQREAREAVSRADELETSNTHLLKRLDKLKNAKSALLKEL